MIMRTEYVNGEISHNKYYGQFVNEEILSMVSGFLKGKSNNLDLNTIQLWKWDNLAIYFPNSVMVKIGKANGSGGVSLSDKVCTLKCAARMIQEKNTVGLGTK